MPEAADDPAVGAVQSDDFHDPTLRVIHWHLIAARQARQEPATLPARIMAAGEYSEAIKGALIDLIGSGVSGSDVRYYAGLVREAARLRKQWELWGRLG